MLAAGLSSTAEGADEPKKYGRDGMPNGWTDSPLTFVSIADDGTVTIVCHRSEMGQGVRTGMPMIVADELEADWKRVRVAQAPGDEKRYGNQDTDGSRSTRHFFDPMRRCGRGGPDDARIRGGQAVERAGERGGGEEPRGGAQAVGQEARIRRAREGGGQGVGAGAETLRLKDPKDFRYIGKGNLKLVDAPDMVTGKAKYGMDTRWTACSTRLSLGPRSSAARLASVDDSAALKVPGVVKVVQIEGSPAPPFFNPLGGVAVIGRNTWAAMQGRQALKITWDDGPNASYDSKAYRASLEASARKPAKVVRNDGDYAAAAAKAAKRLEAEYYMPHLAHATMEPPAATARVTGSKCEVWGCFQSPQATKDLVAKRLGISPDDVTVTSPCWAAASVASPSPTSASRRRCSRRPSTVSR